MTEDDMILKSIGLTRANVERLTKDMKPTFHPCPASVPPMQYLYNWLKRWNSLSYSQAVMLTGIGKLRNHISEWNESHPDKQIHWDEFKLGSQKYTFIHK